MNHRGRYPTCRRAARCEVAAVRHGGSLGARAQGESINVVKSLARKRGNEEMGSAEGRALHGD
ncbi:hypothetical protein TYRP_019394 [Tyrophagus putrescentiae]|nr:hypothetical protein TYRP_019394 [Tyrophagus putrescentiae]